MSTVILEPIVTFAPTRPIDQRYTRNHVCLVSIWPARLGPTMRKHNGLTHYVMEAAPRGSYSKLVVYDTQQAIVVPLGADEKGNEIIGRDIPARVVADDLVAHWGGDMLGAKQGHRAGIGIIAGDEPTPVELKALRDTQNALFNYLITDAMGKHISGEGVNISDTHRLAAKEMLDKGANRLPWFPTTDFAEVKDCIACGTQIEAKAKICPNCRENIVDWYTRYDLDSSGDPVVHSFIQMLKLKKENTDLKAPLAKKDLEPRLAAK